MPTGIPKVISFERRQVRLRQVKTAVEELGREAVLEYIDTLEQQVETPAARVERLLGELSALIRSTVGT